MANGQWEFYVSVEFYLEKEEAHIYRCDIQDINLHNQVPGTYQVLPLGTTWYLPTNHLEVAEYLEPISTQGLMAWGQCPGPNGPMAQGQCPGPNGPMTQGQCPGHN